MSRTRIIYGGLAGILAALVIVMIPIMSSCKKELSVDPVPQARDLVGSVRETPSGQAVKSANVSLQLCDGTRIQTTTTDTAGNFVFSNIPIIPEGSCYRVVVQVAGYNPKDTTVNCNCEQLQVGVLFVRATSCLLDIAPPAVNVGVRRPGETVDTVFTLKNPGIVSVKTTQLALLGAPGTTGFTLDATNARVAEDVLPNNTDIRNFRVRFSSTQPGVHRDTVLVGKGCDNTPHRVPLEATIATCALSFTPLALNFGILENGYRDSTITVVVRNSSPITAHIDSIWVEGGATFTIDSARASQSLAPNATMTVRVTAHPLAPSPVPVVGRLVVRTDCNSDQNCPATVTVEAPTCNIPSFLNGWGNIPVGRSESTYVNIINTSLVARLRVDSVVVVTTSPAPSPNVYSVKVKGTGVSPYYVNPRDTLKLVVYFRPEDLFTYQGQLQIYSNSQNNCGGGLFNFTGGTTEPPSYFPGVIQRWSPFTNDQFLYKGWRFTAQRAVPDSNNYCNIAFGSNREPIPQGDFGIDTADFRFDGFLPTLGVNTISIHALRGVVWLAQDINVGEALKNPNYENVPSSAFTSPGGCGKQFAQSDVLAIRQTESDKYALIHIKYVVQYANGIQELGFDCKYNIPFRSYYKH